MNAYLTKCNTCRKITSKAYARKHDGQCKYCTEEQRATNNDINNKIATREEQHARYIDCGYLAWDDK